MWTLILASRVLRDQERHERRQQRLASPGPVVHALAATPGARPFLLANASRRPSPTAPQRPPPCHRVPLPFTPPVAIVLAGACAPSLVDALLRLAPSLKMGIHAVRLWGHEAAGLSGGLDAWLHGRLLPLAQPLHRPLSPTLPQAQDRGCGLRQRAAPRLAWASASPAGAPRAVPDLWRSFRARHHLGCSTPPRRWSGAPLALFADAPAAPASSAKPPAHGGTPRGPCARWTRAVPCPTAPRASLAAAAAVRPPSYQEAQRRGCRRRDTQSADERSPSHHSRA